MQRKAPDPPPVHQTLAPSAPPPPPHTQSFWERRAASTAQLVPATSSALHAAPTPATPVSPLQAPLVAASLPSVQVPQMSSRTSFIIGKRGDVPRALGSSGPQSGLVGGSHAASADADGGAREAAVPSAQVPASQRPPLPKSNSFTLLLADDHYAELAKQIPY